MSSILRAGLAGLPLVAFAASPAVGQWSTATLSQPRQYSAAAAIGNKALFAGGYDGSFSDVVDIYDAASNTWSTATLSVPRTGIAAATAGNLALFAGGYASNGVSDVVDVYDDSTGNWSTMSLSQARTAISATSVGTKAIFAGGALTAPIPSDVVDIYDSATGLWSTATLSEARWIIAATTVGDLALFAGGYTIPTATYAVVDVYDDSTGTWSTMQLSTARGTIAGASAGGLAVFGGGYNGQSMDIVDIFDSGTGSWSQTTLSLSRWDVAATGVGTQVLIAGGQHEECCWDSWVSSRVDIFETLTGTWSTAELSAPRRSFNAVTVGGKAIFAGGADAVAYSDVVDIYDPGFVTGYCGPAVANSTGAPATISATGSAVVADDDLALAAGQLPPGQFGYFLAGRTQGFVANPGGSQGNLCLGGTIGRFSQQVQSSGAGGSFSIEVDLANLPSPLQPAVLPGETWNFQAWFRDDNPGPTSNFTGGISIVFS